MRSGPVTTFLGGGHAVRMSVIDQVGLFPAPFFYAHEETDFARRALDAGWSIDYRADIVLQHPRTDPARHAAYYRMTARNRVWLAKRHLPAPLLPVYLASWIAYTLLRRPPMDGLEAWWGGCRARRSGRCGGARCAAWRGWADRRSSDNRPGARSAAVPARRP